MIASFIAMRALNSWRAQYKFQKKFECILELRAHLHGAPDPQKYISSIRNHFADTISTGADHDLFDPQHFPFEIQQSWFEHINSMQRTWALLEALLTPNELRSLQLSADILERQVQEVVRQMINIACGEPKGTLFELHKVGTAGMLDIERSYSSLEAQCRVLLKSIR